MDGSVFVTDSYMITPVVRDWHRLKHAGTEPGLQPFHAPALQINIRKSLAYTYRARWGVGGALLPAIRHSGVEILHEV
jgi:hypothetical protein